MKVDAVVAEPSRSELFSRGGSSPISVSVEFCWRFIPTMRRRSTQLKEVKSKRVSYILRDVQNLE